MTRPCESIIPEANSEVCRKAGLGQRQSFGQRPATIIVDVSVASVGTKPQVVLEAMQEYPTSVRKRLGGSSQYPEAALCLSLETGSGGVYGGIGGHGASKRAVLA